MNNEQTLVSETLTFSTVIQYVIKDTGQVVDTPPRGGVVYTLLIHDLKGFDELAADGSLRDPRHTGRTQVAIIDNRYGQ